MSVSIKTLKLRAKRLFEKRFTKIAVLLVLVCLLSVSALWFWRSYSKSSNSSYVLANKLENRYAKANAQNLKEGDYDSYQYSKFKYVGLYIESGDYGKATALLTEVQEKVPTDKLSTDVYMYLAQISLKKGPVWISEKYPNTN